MGGGCVVADEKVTTPRRRLVGVEAGERVVGAADLKQTARVLTAFSHLKNSSRPVRASMVRAVTRELVSGAGDLFRGASTSGKRGQGHVWVVSLQFLAGSRAWRD